jgi:MFS family permease
LAEEGVTGKPISAMSFPRFRSYMAARMLVTTASETQSVVIAWQIYGMTHRPLDLGLVGLFQFLPSFLLFLVAGQAADRFSRALILQLSCACFAVCSLLLLVMTRAGLRQVWPMFLVLVGIGIVRAFNGPASQAFVPGLVPAEVFPNAVSWSTSIFQAVTTVAPVLGGLLYGWTGGPAITYLLAAAEALVAILFVRGARGPRGEGPRRGASLESLLEGLRYVRDNRLILGAISLDLFAVLLGGAVALMPVIARDVLAVGALGLGLLRGAPSAGAVIMAVALARYPVRRKAGLTMLACVAGFGFFTILFGVSRSLAISIVALVLAGACDMFSVVVRHVVVQLGTPDAMRGRVSAVNGVFIVASNEIGQFESGLTAQWFGARPAIVLGGIGTLLVVAIWARFFPALRRYDRLQEVPAAGEDTALADEEA